MGHALMRGAVPGEHVGRNASPGRDLDALLTGPCPDIRLVVPGRPRTAPRPPGRGNLARRVNVGANRFCELGRVLLVQVDLILGPADPEPEARGPVRQSDWPLH